LIVFKSTGLTGGVSIFTSWCSFRSWIDGNRREQMEAAPKLQASGNRRSASFDRLDSLPTRSFTKRTKCPTKRLAGMRSTNSNKNTAINRSRAQNSRLDGRTAASVPWVLASNGIGAEQRALQVDSIGSSGAQKFVSRLKQN
jgi:hypothetical protein